MSKGNLELALLEAGSGVSVERREFWNVSMLAVSTEKETHTGHAVSTRTFGS